MAQTQDSSAASKLDRLVVKDGVHLASLPAVQLPWALGCAWAALPDRTLTEREVNQHLQAALAGAACWLDTDHVELRRWLVDAGWLTRDGYGRAYLRVLLADLPIPLQPVGAALAAIDISTWVIALRQRHRAQRAARRLAWQQQVS